IGTQYNGTGASQFWNTEYNFFNKFTSKSVISGHQTSENDGNAYVKWDVSDLGAGTFVTALCCSSGDNRWDAQFSILVDGEKKAESAIMKGVDGLWKASVDVPADAKELAVIINWGDDNITCGDFTVADPIFIEDPPAPEPSTNPDDPSPTTSDVLVSAAVVVAVAAAAVVVFSRKKRV
ncbi:MAG: NPCBM/NEW2 domain-containing protein, partial [Clostridia bacterium]|nr:NPCBM/NEW2 domain-containing protein [Clostridia bacterium]